MGAFDDRVLKVDLQTGDRSEHIHGDGRSGFEMIFAPHPAGRGEDHGWLLGYVWDPSTDTSDAVILDAADLTKEPVARIHIPQRVPFGPHGVWIPGDQLPVA